VLGMARLYIGAAKMHISFHYGNTCLMVKLSLSGGLQTEARKESRMQSFKCSIASRNSNPAYWTEVPGVVFGNQYPQQHHHQHQAFDCEGVCQTAAIPYARVLPTNLSNTNWSVYSTPITILSFVSSDKSVCWPLVSTCIRAGSLIS